MFHSRLVIVLIVASLFSSIVLSAPAETPSTENPAKNSQPNATAATPATTQPDTDKFQDHTIEPAKLDEATDQLVKNITSMSSNFTCSNKKLGYYADVERQCKLYFFCLPGEYKGVPVAQRISYLCLNGTIFDQKALDCVEKPSVECEQSPEYYESSNEVVRAAVKLNSTDAAVEEAAQEEPKAQ